MSGMGIEKLVERQMRNWELAQGQQHAVPVPGEPRIFEFLTVSRQKSSGGSAVAQEFAQCTGWQMYDREILNYMAHDNAVQTQIYELADEHVRGYLELILEHLGLEGHRPGADYFRKLVNAVTVIAQTNHAVFVGRGVNFILPAEHGLRVRVIAPAKARFQRYAQQAGCSIEEAAQTVNQLDVDRDEFVRAHFHVDPAAPEHYDVVINTASVSLETAAAMLMEGMERKTHLQLRRQP